MSTTIPPLPPRYRTLLRYARDQKITRAQAGRGIHWAIPERLPWQSLERWLRELVLPSGATSVRLYAVAHDKERLLTDFPLGAEPSETAPTVLPLEHLLRLEQRLAELEQRIAQLELSEEEEEEEDAPPAWLAAIGRDLLGQLGLGAVSSPPQEEVGEQESAE